MHIGTSIANGRFLIFESIGKGSFGEIYTGIDTSTPHNKEVAIKLVSFSDSQCLFNIIQEHKHCKVKVLESEARILK